MTNGSSDHIKTSESFILGTLLILLALHSVGCVPVVTSAFIAGAADETRSADEYLVQIQSFRLNAGLSRDEFDLEMWNYVPEKYSMTLRYRIGRYAKAYCKPYCRKPGGAKATVSIRHVLKRFPELEARYDAINETELEYSDRESFWDMKSMAYRAVRLRDDASEETIIEELRQSDLFFNRRYLKYQKTGRANRGRSSAGVGSRGIR